MKPTDLHAIWSAPDNTRLTAKQTSVRLPVHVAAKLAALGQLYPGKSKTQLIGDLLANALDASIEGLPSVKGKTLDVVRDEDGEAYEIYADIGPRAKFKYLANEHYVNLERELGNEGSDLLYPYDYVREGETARDSVEAFQYLEGEAE